MFNVEAGLEQLPTLFAGLPPLILSGIPKPFLYIMKAPIWDWRRPSVILVVLG